MKSLVVPYHIVSIVKPRKLLVCNESVAAQLLPGKKLGKGKSQNSIGKLLIERINRKGLIGSFCLSVGFDKSKEEMFVGTWVMFWLAMQGELLQLPTAYSIDKVDKADVSDLLRERIEGCERLFKNENYEYDIFMGNEISQNIHPSRIIADFFEKDQPYWNKLILAAMAEE